MSNQIDFRALLQQTQQQAGYAAGEARKALAAAAQHQQSIIGLQTDLRAWQRNWETLQESLRNLSANRAGGNPSLQYVENIPGRRIPFDYVVEIPIGANTNSQQQGTIIISQEGPFVAVMRYATFRSLLSYQFVDPETSLITSFQAQSFGRFRPIHSAWDLYDGMPRSQVVQAQAFPGSAASHMFSPSNASSFRSMEQDFMIKFFDAGSSFPRSNLDIPSPFWTTQINSPFELGALDVFERGEVLTFNVQPLHVSNPSAGSISGFGAVNALYPFAGAGWDAVEGISDPETAGPTTDPVTRVANGILTIGFHGYRIIQPAGAGAY
jgi:hypothetical protein